MGGGLKKKGGVSSSSSSSSGNTSIWRIGKGVGGLKKMGRG